MYDTMSPESMPPERNAPSGTSLSSRSCTAARSVSSTDSSSSSSPRRSVDELRDVPVPARRDPPVGDQQPMPRHELVNASIDRIGRQEVAERQIAFECLERQIATPARHSGKRIELARKVEDAVEDGVEQRLLSQPVAREERRARTLVVDGEGEHAIEPFDDGGTVFLPRVKDGLGVGSRPEAVAFRNQIGAQVVMVVDLAVEDDPARVVFVADRLVAAGAVDDRETPEAENRRLRLVKPIAVGAAVIHRVGHRTD